MSEHQSILTVNNQEATLLYPWDIYESAKENSKLKSLASPDYENLYPDKYIAQMISIFSPWILNGYDSVAWHEKMEYADDGKSLIFFIEVK